MPLCCTVLCNRQRQKDETNLKQSLLYSHLCLDVISCHYVSYSSQGRGGHLIVSVPAEREV